MLGISFYILSVICASSSQIDNGEKIEYEQYSLDVDVDTRSWYEKVKDNMFKEKKEELEHRRNVLQYEEEKERELAVKKAKEEKELAAQKAKEERELAAQKLKKEEGNREKQKSTQVASRGNDFAGRKYRVETLTVTAYSPLDDKNGINSQGDPTKTATGTYPQHGTVAVNPKRFPYGTKFYIEGYGMGRAEDTGGAMRQNSSKIDIVMPSYSEAMAWGVRQMEVIIFED